MMWLFVGIYLAIGFGILCAVSYYDGKHKRTCVGMCWHPEYEMFKMMAVPMWPAILILWATLGLAIVLMWCFTPITNIVSHFENLGRRKDA